MKFIIYAWYYTNISLPAVVQTLLQKSRTKTQYEMFSLEGIGTSHPKDISICKCALGAAARAAVIVTAPMSDPLCANSQAAELHQGTEPVIQDKKYRTVSQGGIHNTNTITFPG